MQISELATASRVPVATVKFYLREGLLPPGEMTGITRAQYTQLHVDRLRLVRSLVDVAGLSLSAVRRVLAAAEGPVTSIDQAVGQAQESLPPVITQQVDTTEALRLVDELGWLVDPTCTPVRQLAVAIGSLRDVGAQSSTSFLAQYGHAVHALAEREIAAIPTTSQQDAVRYVVVGTLFYEPVLLALRRLAQQDAFTRHTPAELPSHPVTTQLPGGDHETPAEQALDQQQL